MKEGKEVSQNRNRKEKKNNLIFSLLSFIITATTLFIIFTVTGGNELKPETWFLLLFFPVVLGLIVFSTLKGFTIVEEGTAKIVLYGKGFENLLIQWKGRSFDSKTWDVVEERKRHLLGGIRWYGFWPLWTIHKYRFRWKSPRPDGTIVDHDEVLNSVLLKDFVYAIEIKGAEERDKIPLDITLLLTVRVVNPYKALFKVQDWLELVMNRTAPLFREYVARHTYEELLSEEQAARVEKGLWQELLKQNLIGEFRDHYGVEIKEGGIEMKDITPPPEYQRVATKRFLGEREAEARGAETTGALIQMLVQATGKESREVREGLHQIPQELRDDCLDLIHRQMAIDGGSFLDIRIPEGGDLQRTLISAIATLKRMPLRESKSSSGKKKIIDLNKEEIDSMSEEELVALFLKEEEGEN